MNLPRGRRLKTKKREAKALAQAATEGELKAESKFYKKNPLEWLKQRLSDMTKTTDIATAVDLTTAIALTPIVKAAIDSSEDLRGRIQDILGAKPTGLPYPFSRMWTPLAEQLGLVTEADKFEGLFPDWFDWIIAFGLSWLLVRNFGQILQATGSLIGSVTGILKMFLGAGI